MWCSRAWGGGARLVVVLGEGGGVVKKGREGVDVGVLCMLGLVGRGCGWVGRLSKDYSSTRHQTYKVNS